MLLSIHVTLLDWGVATAGLNESLKTDTLTTCTCSTNAPNPITKNAEKSCQKYVVLKHFEKKVQNMEYHRSREECVPSTTFNYKKSQTNILTLA